MGSKKAEEGPLTVKQGSVSVKIYSTERTKNGRIHTDSTIIWYELDGRRCRKACADLATAKTEAADVAARFSRGTAATKTATRRVVPIQDNLAAWLAPLLPDPAKLTFSGLRLASSIRSLRVL